MFEHSEYLRLFDLHFQAELIQSEFENRNCQKDAQESWKLFAEFAKTSQMTNRQMILLAYSLCQFIVENSKSEGVDIEDVLRYLQMDKIKREQRKANNN